LAQLVQTSVYYGIESMNYFINLESDIENNKNLPFFQKMYFFIHHSIFIQMALMVLLLSIVLIIVHYTCKRSYDKQLSMLASSQNDKPNNEDKLSIDGGKLNIKSYI
jgi:hypothetical protein